MNIRPKRRQPVFAVLAVLCLGLARDARAADIPTGRLESPIVVVQIPVGLTMEHRPAPAGGMLRADYGDGGRIVRLDPDGQLQVLSEGFHSAGEFDVSFDAERILFAAKRGAKDVWNIWEMRADGSGARQITRNFGNCRSPAYQATLYTIVSTEPWYQIMFVSDEAGALNEYGSGPARSLYSCKLDGSAARRMTMNLSDDLDPFLMDDGRVLLAGWQRMDLRRGPKGRIALFAVNTDGTDYALFCGDQGRRIKHMPCVTTEGLVVFVEADQVGWDGAGQLGSVTLRRNFYSHRSVTDNPSWLYHSPAPLRDGAVLVSSRPAEGGGTHGVYRLDPRTGQRDLIFDSPDSHEIHAKVLTPRPEPDGRSSVVNEKYPTGVLYCLNAYLTDPRVTPHMQPGMIRGVRVIEGVPSSDVGIVHVAQKRVLGRAAVEDDGSFHLELPADVPIQLQTLDANGMALRSCGWIWVKHREPRGCIGCHEDPELTPENKLFQAVQRPAVQLKLPAQERRTIDFRRDVTPIIARKCTSCHQGEGAGLDLRVETKDRFSRAYESLLTDIGRFAATDKPVVGKYVHPGQARTSPLIWRLYGRNTSRPWDSSYRPGQTVPVCPPPEAPELTGDEKTMFVEWVDLGAHWDGIPGDDDASTGAVSEVKSEGVK